MCFYGDIFDFWGEIDEKRFHLGGHRWPRRGRGREAAKLGRDGNDEKEDKDDRNGNEDERRPKMAATGTRMRGGREGPPLMMELEGELFGGGGFRGIGLGGGFCGGLGGLL